MKTKILNWLIKLLQPNYTQEQKRIINTFKSMFRIYFEGWDFADKPICPYKANLLSMQITDFKFDFISEDKMDVTITLNYPGVIIGKGGQIIDHLEEFLSDYNVNKLIIKESDLWKSVK